MNLRCVSVVLLSWTNRVIWVRAGAGRGSIFHMLHVLHRPLHLLVTAKLLIAVRGLGINPVYVYTQIKLDRHLFRMGASRITHEDQGSGPRTLLRHGPRQR